MTFTPSLDQSRALSAISAWLASRDKPFFTLHGLAGTGKTTIACHLASQHSGPVYAMAYSGKAALVLTRKGLPASTIHSRIYIPSDARKQEAEDLERELNASAEDSPEARKIMRRLEELRQPAFVLRPGNPFDPRGLIVLDECSMVGGQLAADLMSFKLPILVLGDPGQLPPIEGGGYFDREPDFTLTEIHRQALESPVIRLAMLAREGKALPRGAHGSSKVIRRNEIGREEALGVEQILTGSNKARVQLNNEVRKLKGFDGAFPRAGERLICLRNNAREGLLNGQIVETLADAEVSPYQVRLRTDAGVFIAHPQCFTKPDFIKSWDYKRRAQRNEFDFAWACTIHKAQGSEWESGLVFPDYGVWDRDLFARLRYTGLTRFSDRVIVCQ